MMRQDSGAPSWSTPVRKRPTSSIGRCVADSPMRAGGLSHSADSRSSVSARCAPRLVPAIAWISSTMTVRVVRSIRRPLALVTRMYSDSGVVTTMCGGRRRISARACAGVSPVRTATRTSTSAMPDISSSSRMPASGACRLRSMSLLSARSGETYTTWVSSASECWTPSRTSASMAQRNAASVLPEPVGAAISVWPPAAIAGQACRWHSVGSPRCAANQPATAG